MKRTTIMLPQSLRVRAIKQSQSLGISLGELIRQSLEKMLDTFQNQRVNDPFFDDKEIFTGESPQDLSINHDRYLYEDDQ